MKLRSQARREHRSTASLTVQAKPSKIYKRSLAKPGKSILKRCSSHKFKILRNGNTFSMIKNSPKLKFIMYRNKFGYGLRKPDPKVRFDEYANAEILTVYKPSLNGLDPMYKYPLKRKEYWPSHFRRVFWN